MRFKLAALLVAALLAVSGSAQAQNLSYGGGLKEQYDIPAPIPNGGAVAVPYGAPIPEGFTYYMRADLGWAFAGNRSYSETGRVYGNEPAPFLATAPFTSAVAPFTSGSTNADDVFLGTIGFGAYFTPHLRGDLTLDFRGSQGVTSTGGYTYTSTTGETVTGAVRDTTTLRGVVGLANLYFDLLPRGAFTPYVGAGIGFVYNDAKRNYRDNSQADDGVGGITTDLITGSSGSTNVALAGALMAGASFALNQTWVIDVSYRALYLGGIDVTGTPLNTTVPSTSKATIGDTWEQQVRVGLRLNVW